MIPKAYRLVLKPHQPFRGRKHSFPWGIILVAPSTTPQWSVSVSKRAEPSAVRRNRLRRQLTQFLYQHRQQFDTPTALHIIISRPQPDIQAIQHQLCSFLSIKS